MMHLSAVKEVRIGPVRMGNRQRMVLMAGAMAAGDEATSVSIARSLKDLATSMRIQFVYRTRVAPSATEDILPVVDTLARIREEVEVPIIVHQTGGTKFHISKWAYG